MVQSSDTTKTGSSLLSPLNELFRKSRKTDSQSSNPDTSLKKRSTEQDKTYVEEWTVKHTNGQTYLSPRIVYSMDSEYTEEEKSSIVQTGQRLQQHMQTSVGDTTLRISLTSILNLNASDRDAKLTQQLKSGNLARRQLVEESTTSALEWNLSSDILIIGERGQVSHVPQIEGRDSDELYSDSLFN